MRKLAIGILVVAAGTAVADLLTFDRAAWTADYAAMKRGMAQHYANLDWVADERKLDLVALDKRTRARLEGARSHAQAYLALGDFVAAFGDPHLKLEWGRSGALPSGSTVSSVSTADAARAADCESAGYESTDTGFDARMASLPGWRQIGAGHFPTAIAGELGIIRIAAFGENQYFAACQRAQDPGMDSRKLQLATRAELQKDLVAAIEQLKRSGAKRLLIDLTGNGGGSEWNVEAAALFTSKPMRRAHPRLANAPCDRSAVWQGLRPCRVFGPDTETATISGTGNWTGPVAILADRGTASASEEFIGWLVDNKAARLVGERTMGAGCGYVDGGRLVALRAAPLTLKMPNCARYSAAGHNEIDGWQPDLPLPFPEEGKEGDWGEQLIAAVNS